MASNKHTQQYTTWNLILSMLQPILNISPECMFVNSITTWNAFQFGATDNAKLRLMEKNKIKKVHTFVLLDIIAHYLPMLGWGYVILRNKRNIKYYHVLRPSIWMLIYYILVGKGLNCEKQYVKYPYMRQVFQTISTPLLIKYVVNNLIHGNVYPLVLYLSYIWYSKDYLDICDNIQRRTLRLDR